MNILFVGAHPDDIETWAGGTAALYSKEGHHVFFCVATNGNVGSPDLAPEQIALIRKNEAQEAAQVIGAELIWLDFDDEFLIDSRETRLKFIEAFRISRPDVVFCHWREDYQPDHAISGMLVDECILMSTVPNIITEHKPCEKVAHVYFMDSVVNVNFVPELFVDISDVLETKIKMVSLHMSQNVWLKAVYGCELRDFIEVPARFRGFQGGYLFAEAFRPSYRWGRTFNQHYLPVSDR